MGLDMCLNGHKWLMPSYSSEDKSVSDNIGLLVGVPPTYPVTDVKVEIGCWRKANQIHAWFVDNVQNGKDDCNSYRVSRDQLLELKEACNQVIEEPNLAESTLPTRSGFFFGSTDYGTDYLQDLKNTIEIIDKALALDETWDIKYSASW